MLKKDLTTFQKMSELEKREFIQRFISVFNADQKAFDVLLYNLESQKNRLESNHINLSKMYPSGPTV